MDFTETSTFSLSPNGEAWWAGDLPDRNIEAKLYSLDIKTYEEIEALIEKVGTALLNLIVPTIIDNKTAITANFDGDEIASLHNTLQTRRDRKAGLDKKFAVAEADYLIVEQEPIDKEEVTEVIDLQSRTAVA